jgi:hypothetical protein
MVDDCLAKADQEAYLKGMRAFEGSVRSLTGRSFADASAEERLQILKTFEEKLKTADENVRIFYSKTRGYIIQGYTSSQHFLTKVKPYQLVPGPDYKGCVPVSDSKTVS